MNKRLIALFLCSLVSTSQAEIYKWQDEQGNIHYGDKPVDNSKEVEVSTKKSGNQDSVRDRNERRKKLTDSLEEDRIRKQDEAEKLKKEKKKHKRKCEVAKQRLQGYERAGYLYRYDKDGNKVIRTNEERQKATDDLRKKIEKNCK